MPIVARPTVKPGYTRPSSSRLPPMRAIQQKSVTLQAKRCGRDFFRRSPVSEARRRVFFVRSPVRERTGRDFFLPSLVSEARRRVFFVRSSVRERTGHDFFLRGPVSEGR